MSNLTLKEFKNEFRLVCCDTWGECMNAWFESAGHLNKRSTPIPDEWEYKPGLGDGTDKDCYWYKIFEDTETNDLLNVGKFLFRYAQFLKFKGVDY